MKKIVLFVMMAACSVIACQKEQNKEQILTPEEEPIKEVVLTSISASAGEVQTKTSVDGLQVKWSKDDVIGVADNENTIVPFQLQGDGNVVSGSFDGDLGGKTLGTYAVYPKTTNSAVADHTASVDYLTTWAYGKSEVPMYGVNDGTGSYTFHNIGGAIQVSYSNIPTTSKAKFFRITETHTGGGEMYITGTVNLSTLNSTPTISLSSLDGQVINVTGIAKDAKSVTLIIPVPAQDGYNFKIELYENDATSPIPGSLKTATNKNVTAGKILRFPNIALPIFLETFGEAGDNTPTYASYTGYSAIAPLFTTEGTVNSHYSGDGKIGKSTYAEANLSNGYTGASGLSGCYHSGVKNTTKTILTISNINIAGYENLSLSFGALGGSASHTVSVTYKIDDGSETTLISSGAITNASWTLLSQSIPSTGNSLTLNFKHTPSKAWLIRMDDIKVTGTPIP